MRKLTWLPILCILECIAVEIGLFAYNALHNIDHRHLLLGTSILCAVAAIAGVIVTRPRAQTISCGMLLLGLLALGLGFFFVTLLNYHERAAVTLGVGLLCLIASMAGLVLPRLPMAICSNVIAFGIITLGISLYFLNDPGDHVQAYFLLAFGSLCLLASLTGIIVTFYREREQMSRKTI